MKICNQLVKKVKKIWFLRQEPVWSDLIPARGQMIPGKEPEPKGQPDDPAYFPPFRTTVHCRRNEQRFQGFHRERLPQVKYAKPSSFLSPICPLPLAEQLRPVKRNERFLPV